MIEGRSLHAATRDIPFPNAPDRRRKLRHQNVLHVAKLIIGSFEELCIIREVASGGLKAEVYCPVPIGLVATIELRTGYRATGYIAWCEEDVLGLAFDPDVSAETLLTHCSLDERIGRIRPTRLLVSVPGQLVVGGETSRIELRDASLAGMKIRVGREFEPDTECVIAPESMSPRAATIRWHRNGKAGIQLAEPLRFDEFAEWRRMLAEQPRRLWVID